MSETTGIQEGEEVLIGTERYKCTDGKLVNMNKPDDIIEMADGSLIGTMIENLGIVNG